STSLRAMALAWLHGCLANQDVGYILDGVSFSRKLSPVKRVQGWKLINIQAFCRLGDSL
ncbi:hypothetical protein STEG23_016961, partial [Scotinomys teguina]